MIKRAILLKIAVYIFFVASIAVLMNALPVWMTAPENLYHASFYWICLGTFCLLSLYLIWINKCLYMLIPKRYIGWRMLLQIIPIVLFHLVFLQVLLLQQRNHSLLSIAYFKRDFWFFFIPLLVYVLLLYKKPRFALWYRAKSDIDLLQKEDLPTLLQLWKSDHYMPILRKYLSASTVSEVVDFEGLYLWQLICLLKCDGCFFAYFENGDKWVLTHEEDLVLNNPWLVKINQQSYVNMLYSSYSLVNGRMAIDDQHILKILNQASVDQDTLAISRRLRVNVKDFWAKIYLDELDEKALLQVIK